MRYLSTRGMSPSVDFDTVLLSGTAPDGGLYLPESWPVYDSTWWRSLRGCDYTEIVCRIVMPFMGDSPLKALFPDIVREAYAGFHHPAIAPMQQIDQRLMLLELFHGPTLAFKDFALQVLGRLMDAALQMQGRRATVIGATSGDTGSAAIAGCQNRAALDVVILHPHGRTSDIQRRQMTCASGENIHNLAIEGDFDDCQSLVKSLFNQPDICAEFGLVAVNSINWLRIIVQTAYYVAAAVMLGAPDAPVAFCVPSGNFGNAFAAFCAVRMGLPIETIIVATNRNDILARFFQSGIMQRKTAEASISPSMDIQAASNFERLLYLYHGGNGAAVRQNMEDFSTQGQFSLPAELFRDFSKQFASGSASDGDTSATMRHVWENSGVLLDPHTAVGVNVARQKMATCSPHTIMVSLGCAHPAKFPDAVFAATGQHPPLPDFLAGLDKQPERYHVMSASEPELVQYLRTRVSNHKVST